MIQRLGLVLEASSNLWFVEPLLWKKENLLWRLLRVNGCDVLGALKIYGLIMIIKKGW